MLTLLDNNSGHFLRKTVCADRRASNRFPLFKHLSGNATPHKKSKKTANPFYRQTEWNSWNTVCFQPKLVFLLSIPSRSKHFLPHVLVTSISYSIRAPASRIIFPHRDSALDEIKFPRITSKS